MPAKAGIHSALPDTHLFGRWMPAFAGMTIATGMTILNYFLG
jgi:hypothetical protein